MISYTVKCLTEIPEVMEIAVTSRRWDGKDMKKLLICSLSHMLRMIEGMNILKKKSILQETKHWSPQRSVRHVTMIHSLGLVYFIGDHMHERNTTENNERLFNS